MRQNDPRPWLHDILEAVVGVRAAVGSGWVDAASQRGELVRAATWGRGRT